MERNQMNKHRFYLPVLLPVLALIAAILACSSPSESDQLVRTLLTPTIEGEVQASATEGEAQASAVENEASLPTSTPAPTPTEEVEGLVTEGTHLVGTDIEPGIYAGLAGEGMDTCYWARLSNLTGQDDILANANAEGLYYVEVLPTDAALNTRCELLPLDKVPTQEVSSDAISAGTYLVGRDIEAGIYVGLAGEGIDTCYWARLSNLTGQDDILANENAEGLYYIEVLPSDTALQTRCELLTLDQAPVQEISSASVPIGTYLVGRDIDPGLYRGEAGTDMLDSCYWSRLSNVNGENNILANGNETGQYFVEVLPTDFAAKFGCEVQKVE